MIKAVIFDWGGVLIDLPANGILSYCSNELKVRKKDLNDSLSNHLDDFQKGKIKEKTLWDKVCKELNVQKPKNISLWYEAFESAYLPKKDMFLLTSKLKDNYYKTGLLSNTEMPALDYFKKQNYDMFDVEVFSCEEGIAKPERRIYDIMLSRLYVSPQEAVFIDDRPLFIDGARKLGMNTILFSSPYQVKKELKNLNIKLKN
ncbi:MAG: HAD family phosphatase [Nanoarchaeota archaeon]|nr:HAD family phosphatase [Nanoarchaeota archaeon]